MFPKDHLWFGLVPTADRLAETDSFCFHCKGGKHGSSCLSRTVNTHSCIQRLFLRFLWEGKGVILVLGELCHLSRAHLLLVSWGCHPLWTPPRTPPNRAPSHLPKPKLRLLRPRPWLKDVAGELGMVDGPRNLPLTLGVPSESSGSL